MFQFNNVQLVQVCNAKTAQYVAFQFNNVQLVLLMK